MLSKKYAATAALLMVPLLSGTLLVSCASNPSLPVSNAATHPVTTEDALSPVEPKAPQPESKPDLPPASTQEEAPASKPQEKPKTEVKPPAEDKPSVDNSYFDDALFIGDSLTEGFQLHGGITNATYYGFKNLNVKDVFEKPLVKSHAGKITVSDAIKKNAFGKYYIMLGANELGWVYPEVFTKKYGELIDLILQKNPDARIYLQSVFPVTEEVSLTSKVYSNDRIDHYDQLIAGLAQEKGVTYLNVREAVENENNILPDEAATDGVHLNKEYCRKWADYLRQHQ